MLAVLIWWLEAWPAVIGMALTICCALAVQLSPLVPPALKNSPWLIYLLVVGVYVSVVSSWLGEKRAGDITASSQAYTSILRTEAGIRNELLLIGRLGDTYALWNPSKKMTTLFPAKDITSLEIGRKDSGVLAATK